MSSCIVIEQFGFFIKSYQKITKIMVKKTENPFSLKDDEHKIIRSPKKP